MRVICLIGALLSGCSAFRVSERAPADAAPGDTGTLVVKAVDSGRKSPAGGFQVDLTRKSESVAVQDSRPGAPTVFRELPPGRYDVWVSGKRCGSRRCTVRVRAGSETVVRYSAGTARRLEAVEELALVTGKTALYVVTGIGYVVWVSIECIAKAELDDDDDGETSSRRCSTCGRASCRCRKVSPPPAPPRAPDPGPRVRDLLKKEKQP